jgi:hypothetical protein
MEGTKFEFHLAFNATSQNEFSLSQSQQESGKEGI